MYRYVLSTVYEENRDTIAAQEENAVLYYWLTDNGAKDGLYCSFDEPFSNNWIMNGEFVVLQENIVLGENLQCSSSIEAGESFTLTTAGFTIGGGTIKLTKGVTVISDSNSLVCFIDDNGTIISASENENGTYSYVY